MCLGSRFSDHSWTSGGLQEARTHACSLDHTNPTVLLICSRLPAPVPHCAIYKCRETVKCTGGSSRYTLKCKTVPVEAVMQLAFGMQSHIITHWIHIRHTPVWKKAYHSQSANDSSYMLKFQRFRADTAVRFSLGCSNRPCAENTGMKPPL